MADKKSKHAVFGWICILNIGFLSIGFAFKCPVKGDGLASL